jgi:molybdopterin synthase sulfur carrier subunit
MAFGIVREFLGSSTIRLDVNDGITVGELRTLLRDHHPDMHGISSIAVALNGNYATDETIVVSNDEIAIIPPVSGG